MQHPLLGQLSAKDNQQQSYSGIFSYEGKALDFNIDRDGDGLEEAMELATAIITSLSKYDAISKTIISKDLLETYNTSWNEYDEIQADGSLKTIINPTLSADEFEARFILEAVSISGNSGVTFWFEENDLFWGHRVSVSSFSGADFGEAQACIYG